MKRDGWWRAVTRFSISMALGCALATVSSAQVARCPDYLIKEGQIVEIGETDIRIREWAGVYTYRLDSTERWRMEADQIGPGDTVQFMTCNNDRIAKAFKKL
jgi:hypothetical protein